MPLLLGSVNAGWTCWEKKVAGAYKSPTARLRANAVHDAVAEKLEASIRRVPGLRFSRKYDRAWLHIGTDLVIEIHKLDDESVAMRNQTEFAELLHTQQLSNGLGAVTVLTLGYTFDEFGSKLRDVLVVYSIDGKLDFAIDLVNEVGATPEQLPARPPKTNRKERIKAKPGVKTTKKPDGGTGNES
ncbi:hypothetical protein [Pyxidicoccus trucidator]|uniref:hypothetical protein n=1 Tax=Pyxidicoccus trucidator TaxID=2709662 RepID=UPI0013DCCF73|nr:hypothetical protein [Pyxidicoccus trucidator]